MPKWPLLKPTKPGWVHILHAARPGRCKQCNAFVHLAPTAMHRVLEPCLSSLRHARAAPIIQFVIRHYHPVLPAGLDFERTWRTLTGQPELQAFYLLRLR